MIALLPTLALVLAMQSAPLPATVTAVSLDSTWGGLGESRSYHGTIRLNNGRYLLDGAPVDTHAIANLLEALEAQADEWVPDADIAGARQRLAGAAEQQAQMQLAELATLPDVKKRFLALYADPTNQAGFLSEYFQPRQLRVMDDYPHEHVTVHLSDGSVIEAEARTPRAYMLPWAVTGSRSRLRTWNPAIAQALSVLFAGRDVNEGRISGSALTDEYGSSVWSTYQAKYGEPDTLRLLPGAEDVLRQEGAADVQVDLSGHAVMGSLVDKNWPRALHASFKCTLAASDDGTACVSQALLLARRALQNPQLSAFMKRRVRVDVSDRKTDTLDEYAGYLRRAGAARRGALSSFLRSHDDGALYVDISDANGYTPASNWLLMQDGSLLLMGYNEGALAMLGIDEKRTGGTGYYRFIGALMQPDGSFRKI